MPRLTSLLVAALLLGSCAPASTRIPPPVTATNLPPPSPPTTQRLALPDGVDASYTLELVREPFPSVVVTFVTRGLASGKTEFALENWGGVEHVESDVRGLKATDQDGHVLPVSFHAGRDDGGPTWTVDHAPGALLRVRYALAPVEYDSSHTSGALHRALLKPTFFQAIGNTCLLDVRDRPEHAPLHIAFHWRGFADIGWTVASSFGVEQDFVTTATLDTFRHAVFLAGDLHLARREIGPTRSPLLVAIAGSDWGFADDAFADLAAAVVGAQRSFFQDYDWPLFLISVVPVGPPASEKSSMLSGTSLTNSFAVYLSPKIEIKETPDGVGVAWLLSHELFHMWNGQRYELSSPEQLAYWFSEGFTNFFARRLLYRAGLLSARGFVANLDDELRRYAVSPVRGEPATRVAQDFWKDSAVKDLPYQRGDVIALLIDAEIRRVSLDHKSLDDLMKRLLGARTESRPKLSSDSFLAAIASDTSPAFAERMRKIAMDGAVAIVDLRSLEPCLHGRVVATGPYELGLDDTALTKRHEITGVVSGSAAYRAGARNGQRAVGWSIYGGDPLHTVELTVMDAGVKRTVRYLPQGKPIDVVQFDVDAELPAACAKML